jgi:hypothetical protein
MVGCAVFQCYNTSKVKKKQEILNSKSIDIDQTNLNLGQPELELESSDLSIVFQSISIICVTKE